MTSIDDNCISETAKDGNSEMKNDKLSNLHFCDESGEGRTTFNDAEYLLKLKPPSSFQPNSFLRLKCLGRPWDHQEDPEIDTEPYYDAFCSALKDYQEDTLEDKAKEWSSNMEFLMPGITCCIRRYVDALTDEAEVEEFEERLADWVEFGLSLEIAERYASESIKHIQMGCRLARRIFLMRRRQFAKKLAVRHILHRLIDVIQSSQLPLLQRCDAANCLFASLFHSSATIPIFFSQIETDLSGETCYARLVHCLMENLPIRVALALQPCVDHAGFACSTSAINELARNVASKALTETDNEVVVKHISRVSRFLASHGNKGVIPSSYLYRTMYENEILTSLAILVTSREFTKKTKELALCLLAKLISFDGVDISGPYFLASCSSEIIGLCLKIFSVIDIESENEKLDGPSTLVNVNALSLALRALNLLDELAFINQQECDCIDSPKRISVLLDIFILSSNQRSDGGKAVIAALSHSSNIEHLLEIFTFGQMQYLDQRISDEVKTTLRHTVCYGYACEVLLTLARLQTDGVFWRRYGGIICRLIDSNFISAASSLKQWTEPLRDPMVQCTSPSTVHYLVQRLGYYLEKFKNSNDPPLSAITTLRLIDSILKEKSDNSDCCFCNGKLNRFELFTIFYEENGLQKINELLLSAAEKHTARESEKGLFLASDALIFEMLLYSAVAILKTMVESMVRFGKYVDFSSMLPLLKVYSIFCSGISNRCVTIKSKILDIFSLFVSSELRNAGSIKGKNSPGFLRCFFECGLYPSTITALVEILENLLLQNSFKPSALSSYSTQIALAKKRWSKVILQLPQHLKFIIKSGISSSSALRSSVTTICIRLLRLGPPTAEFVVTEIGSFCSRSLLALPVFLTDDCFDETDSDGSTEGSNRFNEVRFGAAADFTAASSFAFLTQCSDDKVFRYAFTSYLIANPSFVTGVLKFFDVASQRTTAHICFQKQVIVLFKNLCVTTNPHSGSQSLMLPKNLYETFCAALVEHISKKDQSFETALLSLEALYSIASFTEIGKTIVQEAFTLRGDTLMRFACRVAGATACSTDLLQATLSLLSSTLSRTFVHDDKLLKVLQWPPSDASQNESTCGEHPLSSLCELLNKNNELEALTDVAAVFEKLLNFYKDPSDLESNVESSVAKEWESLNKIDEDVLNEDSENSNDDSTRKEQTIIRLVGIKFEPPSKQLDLNALHTEFLQSYGPRFAKRRGHPDLQSSTNRKPLQKKRFKRMDTGEITVYPQPK